MKYRAFIEDNFLIDDAKTGELVPFKFNAVQNKYYDELVAEYDIEKKGLAVPLREDILKARREGFSSLVLALFAADDILSDNPTITQVISYKDDATKIFRQRYKNFVYSFYSKQSGVPIRQIKDRDIFSTYEGGEYTLKHNGAKFVCGTASARTGERGGVVQKLLFSEAAFYPDTENMTAKEIIEGTLRQVDVASGWVFVESTANGKGNYYERLWQLSTTGRSRFRPRFYGWREFYTEDEFKTIASEFTDPHMLKQEYPETPEEAFLASGLNFVTKDELDALVGHPHAQKSIVYQMHLQGTNYIDQCEILKSALVHLEKEHRHSALYAGIDVAKDRDKTTLVVLADKRYNVTGGVKGIAIDSTGAGDFMPDWFANNARWYIEEVKFTRPQKDILYRNLRTVMKEHSTAIPPQDQSEESELLWGEMLDLQKEIKGDLLIVGHPEGDYHDDYPDAWALAEHIYLFYNVPTAREEVKQIGDLPNPLNKMLDRREPARSRGRISFK